jgi:outer membrane biosynthesis protein TonB
MKPSSFLLVALLLLPPTVYSQEEETKDARPEVGWDSLKSLIQYPLLARRAGLEGYADVTVQLDSLGNILRVQVRSYEVFQKPVEYAVRSVKWLPLDRDGPPRGSTVSFEVLFHLKDRSMHHVLEVEAEQPIWILKSK